MESIELFTGAGGLALGTHRAGFAHSALVEWNTNACDTLRTNIARGRAGELQSIRPISDWTVHQSDLRRMLDEGFFSELTAGRLDLVAGGVPCQPFSLGGKHRANTDLRDMFPDFVEVVRQTRPRAFIVENVKGLLRQSFSSYFQYIVLRLTYPDVPCRDGESWREHLHRLEQIRTSSADAGLEYNVVFELLNAADYGVPQTRERVFIVGFRSDVGKEWHFPSPTHSRDALAYEQFVSGQYWDRHKRAAPSGVQPWCGRRLLDEIQSGPPSPMKPWVTVQDALVDLPEPSRSGSLFHHNHIRKDGARPYAGHTGSPIDLPSKTLKAGVHGVPGGENMMVLPDGSVRYFTVREAARIQTFPDDWVFEGAWSEAMRQLGNAVPMQLAEVVAASVYDVLRPPSAFH